MVLADGCTLIWELRGRWIWGIRACIYMDRNLYVHCVPASKINMLFEVKNTSFERKPCHSNNKHTIQNNKMHCLKWQMCHSKWKNTLFERKVCHLNNKCTVWNEKIHCLEEKCAIQITNVLIHLFLFHTIWTAAFYGILKNIKNTSAKAETHCALVPWDRAVPN